VTGRRRGPKPGRGGRPTYTLGTDPDRFIVTAGLWLWTNQGSVGLQLLDAILAPHDAVEFKFETKEIDGETHGVIGVVNTRPEREPDKRTHRDEGRNVAPDRKRHSAPSGKALRRARLDHLRRKIARYRDEELSDADAAFCRAATDAWRAVQFGDLGPIVALAAPDHLARARLSGFLDGFLSALPPPPTRHTPRKIARCKPLI
jgi:hypothetical protein